MSSSGCAQTSSTVPNDPMLSPPSHRTAAAHRGGSCWSLPQPVERCTVSAPGTLSSIEAGIDGGEEGAEPVPEAVRDLVLGALDLDQCLEVDPERGLVRASFAPGEVTLDARSDHIVNLMIEEPLDLSKRLFTLGPTLSHRPVPVLQPSATTHVPALSFPDADDS